MINISLDFDVTINLKGTDELPINQGGAYIFFSTNNEPLYVGKSTNLLSRIKNHFNGRDTKTNEFFVYFDKCSIIFDNDKMHQDIYETYMINTLRPSFNLLKVFNYTPDDIRDKCFSIPSDNLEVQLSKFCTALNIDGTKCKSKSAINGICVAHRDRYKKSIV